MRFHVLGCALALTTAITVTNAQKNASYCPTDDICYTVNVPASGNTQDLFFRISGPASMAWIGLGQGSAMSGANIFVIYADAAGTNVTLSPRLGEGHVEPDSDTSATVTLLDGSMVTDSMMVANVKCSNCQNWTGGTMDFTSTSTDWIYAYQSGPSLASDSVSASISQHDDYGNFNLDLTSATSGDGSVNPFTSPISSGSTTSSSSPLNGNTNSGSPYSSGSGTSSGSNVSSGMGSSDNGAADKQAQIMSATTAHGIMGALAFILLFPSGALVMRLFHFKGVLWVHVAIQLLGYVIALAVLETGVWVAVNNGELTKTHPILGIVTVSALFFQPFLGLGHHLIYRRQSPLSTVSSAKPKNPFTLPHIIYGRIFITLGAINGFLGIKLAGLGMDIQIAYLAVAGTVWFGWVGVVVYGAWRARSRGMDEEERRREDGKDADWKERIRVIRVKEDEGSYREF